ncbi:MAG TPA: fatty acid desaturase [Burkholderiaceae bacterium]|nr:fatty acid desaturase [Burkholderiaceae bacterium]
MSARPAPDPRASDPPRPGADGARRDATVGLALATAIVAAWIAVHVVTVFHWRWTPAGAVLAPLAIALQTWLGAGLFIVAHDAMHGSLAPGRPRLGDAFGRLALALYAGFSYDRLLPKHRLHHRHAGTALDPDFDADHPDAFWPWYGRFMREYMGVREVAALAAITAIWTLLLGAPLPNLLAFWALPAILSSLQLFRWGTWLPHRHDALPFADRHRARSDARGPWVTLLTCFHFGLHHEHHRSPRTPWWRLPALARGAPADRPAPGRPG